MNESELQAWPFFLNSKKIKKKKRATQRDCANLLSPTQVCLKPIQLVVFCTPTQLVPLGSPSTRDRWATLSRFARLLDVQIKATFALMLYTRFLSWLSCPWDTCVIV